MHKKTINMNPLQWRANTQALWLSFLGPAIFIAGYFAFRGVAPFGDNTVLTVDLGQQYIDFIAYLKGSLSHDPSRLLYSFSKGLGGNFYSDGAYYLFSPLNLLLLPFSSTGLPVGIFLLTILRYGLASLSMAWSLRLMRWQNGYMLTMFGIIYALSGWMVVNQLNVIWIDVVILLPLIVAFFERYLAGYSYWPYILMIALGFICNYYMMYMVGLFLICYFLWRLTWEPYPFYECLKMLGKFIFASLMGVGLSAFMWLPTAVTLHNSKGQHFWENVKNVFDHNPLDLLTKFFIGAFDFQQIESGLPNIFVGSLILILCWYFFTTKVVRRSTRVMGLIITVFFVVSMLYQPLNVIWHGFSFPVWYPYRFSFVFIFWLIWLAASVWSPKIEFNKWQAGGLVIITFMVVTLIIYQRTQFDYLNLYQIGLGSAVFGLMIFGMMQIRKHPIWLLMIGFLVVGEMMINTILTLNHLSYLSNREYHRVVKTIKSSTDGLPQKQNDFYRVAKNFQRTKDDPMQFGYAGGSVFSSMLEHQQSELMAVLGQPEGDNYIAYGGGTLISDSMLGIRYLLRVDQNNTRSIPATMFNDNRYDTIDNYEKVSQQAEVETTKNKQALPLIFAADPAVLNFEARHDDPVKNQSNLWRSLLGSDEDTFDNLNFSGAQADNLTAPETVTGAFLSKLNPKQPASLTLNYKKQTAGPAYLTLGSALNADNLEIQVDGQPIYAIPAHRHTMIYTLPNSGEICAQHQIKFILKSNTVWLQNVSLYNLKEKNWVEQAQRLQKQGMQYQKVRATQIRGTVNVPKGETVLMSTIPYAKGWSVYIDGHSVNSVKVANYFLGQLWRQVSTRWNIDIKCRFYMKESLFQLGL
ncbi:YfhO family protein [Weissella coleopterorum]|uniref:YfhO family protein n=1 Tax=Weissella coleopterorum TaxID=2714949 RepID=UPI001FECE61F|nr:YfhO family protein [Weissella coleopterorum]